MKKTDWKAKAEKFLESHLNDDNHNAEEAAVYFLSRRKTNKIISNIVDDTIKRWKEDKTKWSVGCRVNPTGVASMLKLMQWEEIGVLRKYRDTICQDFGVPYSHDFYPDDQGCGGHFSKTAAFFPLIFPIFTSDIAINQMGTKLIFLLHQWQNHLNDLLMRKRLFIHSIDDDQEGNIGQVFATLISAYIFAAYRLGKVGINQDILDKSIQYLLDSQDDSGLWAYDKTAPDSEDDDISGYSLGDFLNSRKHVILAAVGIHAIFLANPIGAKRSIEKAANWLLEHQQSNGGWYNLGKDTSPYNVYATVLALDALEMAEGGNTLTFSSNIQTDPAKEKSDGIVTKTDDLSINEKTQTIFYQGNKILIGGGGATWNLFVLLYEKRGEIVDIKDLRKSIGIHDINKIKYDLCRVLKKNGAEELSKKIKNSHTTGYYLEI